MADAGDMEKGTNADDRVLFRRREQREASQQGSDEVAVGQHHSF
jgi:hypothetical protein